MGLVVLHAIDVESGCRSITNGGMLSLGMCACLVDEKKNTIVRELSRQSINIDWGYPPVTDVATAAWWSQHPAAWNSNRTNLIDTATAAYRIDMAVKEVRQSAEDNGWGYRMVVDNPAFDLMWVDHFMSQACHNFLPIRHHHLTGYIHNSHLVDVAQRKQALIDLGVDLRLGEFSPSVEHDHTPGNDSRHTIDEWMHLRRIIHSMRLRLKH